MSHYRPPLFLDVYQSNVLVIAVTTGTRISARRHNKK